MHRIPDQKWFSRLQPLLPEIVNTNEGRDLLEIDHSFPEITAMGPSYLHALLEVREGIATYTGDFRTAPKWGNLIRHRWEAFSRYAKTIYETQYEGGIILRPL